MFRRRCKAVSHPLYARIYASQSVKAELHGLAKHRARLLSGLSGRVIEVGAGNGLNFAHYPETVTEVLAVEPEDYLRERAVAAAAEAHVPIEVRAGLAERLPAQDECFDAGIASLVLCSVRDPDKALAELFRVMRAGGELRFHEHVRSENSAIARVQAGADAVIWPRLGGGCHLSRDTGRLIEEAGFAIESIDRFTFGIPPLDPPKPHILGIARRPASTLVDNVTPHQAITPA
jgi:ubiquinone/menaquinone biosynthesis C-methylase UbiE